MDKNKNKKALILFRKTKDARTISNEDRNISKDNLASKLTNNTTNNININTINSNHGTRIIETKKFLEKEEEISNKKKNQKRFKKLKLDENNIKINDKEINHKKRPIEINIENNIYYNKDGLKERHTGKIKYNNINNKYIPYKKINKGSINNEKNIIKNRIKNSRKRSKDNEEDNKLMEDISNISNLEKRRNYNVPKVRIKKNNNIKIKKKEKIDNQINGNEKEIEREKNLIKLLENKQNSYIREFQKMVQNTSKSRENHSYENKRKVIEDYGIDIQSLENLDEEDNELGENKQNSGFENRKKEIEEDKININNNSFIKNNDNNIMYNNNEIDLNLNINKEKRKKSVNTLEYYNQIKQNINYEEIKHLYNNYNSIIIKTDSLGESNQKSFPNSTKEKNIKDEKEEKKKEEYDENSSDTETTFNYKSKKNKRGKIEIREYIERQKRKERYKEEQKIKNNQTKKLNRFIGLSKLNEGININMNKKNSKIKNNNKKEKSENIENEYLNEEKDFSKLKNPEESDDTESSKSTIIEKGNYYNDLIIGKNILLNNFLNYTDDNMIDDVDNKNNNQQLMLTKDIIHNSKDININDSNNIILQKEQIKKDHDINEEIYLKCKETLDRFNKLFSDVNMQEFINKHKEKIKDKKHEFNNDNNRDKNIENDIKIDRKENINKSDSKNEENILKISENNLSLNKENINEENNYIIKKRENNYDENCNSDNINENAINKNEKQQIEIQSINNSNKINDDIKEIIQKRELYNFSKEDLDNYYQIFTSLGDYINSLIKRNILNDIINYGDTKLSFKIGLEHLISLLKSYPFNLLRIIYQRQYYKDVLRQLFIPFIRKAYNNLYLFVFHLTKFSEVNRAIEQIYKIIFIKRLIYYGQGKEFIKNERQNIINEFLKELVIIINKYYKQLYFKKLYENTIIEDGKNDDIISDDSSPKKYNTYLYESFTEKSSLTAYPNTERSARLHKVYEFLEMQNKQNDEENIIKNVESNRSNKSEKEKKAMNIFEKIKEIEEDKNYIPYREQINNLNKEKSNKDEEINNEKLKRKIGTENDKNIEISNNFGLNINNQINNPIRDENYIIDKNTNNDKILPNKEHKNKILEINEKKSRNNEIKEIEGNEEKKDSKKIRENMKENSNDIIFKEDNNNIQLNINNNIENSNSEISDRYHQNKKLEIDKNKDSENKSNDINGKIFKNLKEKSIENITDDICENILSEILDSEIKEKKKIFEKKKKEINSSLNNSSASSPPMSQNSIISLGSHSPGRNYPTKKNITNSNNNINNKIKDVYPNINNIQAESMLNNSIFMRTIDEIKKEKNMNSYNDRIFQKFLEEIKNNIEDNYDNIIKNLKIPFEIDEEKMIIGLMLKEKNLSSSSKIKFKNEDIKKNNYIDESVIYNFENINNKEIRTKDNLYNRILNKGVYDSINELIEKERKYSMIGAPLSWSIRSRDIDYKYKIGDKYTKNIFITKIMRQIKEILNIKMGLIPEKYLYLDMEQLNQDRDKKFTESIKQELKENEPFYQIFETQETYVKLGLSKIILDQLFNEIVEILEHVQYSRKEPDKYQSKSIYACEDIPRLSFQPQTLENNYNINYNEDLDADENINQ